MDIVLILDIVAGLVVITAAGVVLVKWNQRKLEKRKKEQAWVEQQGSFVKVTAFGRQFVRTEQLSSDDIRRMKMEGDLLRREAEKRIQSMKDNGQS